MAFVRQRRDENDGCSPILTGPGVSRRSSCRWSSALRHGGALSEPERAAQFAGGRPGKTSPSTPGSTWPTSSTQATDATDSAVSLYTLPITDFGQDSAGEDVNTIDVSDRPLDRAHPDRGDLSAPTSTSKTNAPSSVDSTRFPAASASCHIVDDSPFEGLACISYHVQRARLYGRRTPPRSRTTDQARSHRARRAGRRRATGSSTEPDRDRFGHVAPRHGQLTIGTDFPSSTTTTTRAGAARRQPRPVPPPRSPRSRRPLPARKLPHPPT